MENNLEELVIDESNFQDYFFDTRKHKPQKGQVIAQYTANAELIDGTMKRSVIGLMKTMGAGGVHAACKSLRKLGGATDISSIQLCKSMLQDLISGMSDQEVYDKPYPFLLEMFFYTKPEYIPKDPHWSSITINNLDEFLDKEGNKLELNWKFVEDNKE